MSFRWLKGKVLICMLEVCTYLVKPLIEFFLQKKGPFRYPNSSSWTLQNSVPLPSTQRKFEIQIVSNLSCLISYKSWDSYLRDMEFPQVLLIQPGLRMKVCHVYCNLALNLFFLLTSKQLWCNVTSTEGCCVLYSNLVFE